MNFRRTHGTPSWHGLHSFHAMVNAAVLVMLAASPTLAQAVPDDWPMLPTPPAVEQFQVGNQMVLHGMPVRITGYVAQNSVQGLRDWYRGHVPGPLVENRVGRKLVLGQRQGNYFLTVELEAMMGTTFADYTKVLVATTMLTSQSALQDKPPALQLPALLQGWPDRLPQQTQLISELSDRESGKDSLHLTAANRHGLDYNEAHVMRELERLDFRLEARHETRNGLDRSLLFSGSGHEAALVLTRMEDGRTSIVLNLIAYSSKE